MGLQHCWALPQECLPNTPNPGMMHGLTDRVLSQLMFVCARHGAQELKSHSPVSQGDDEGTVLHWRGATQENLSVLAWLRRHFLTNTSAAQVKATHHVHSRVHTVVVASASCPTNALFLQLVPVPAVSSRVSPQHHGFACALALAGTRWNDLTWQWTFLEHRGNKEEWIRTQVLEITERVKFVQMQLGGLIPRTVDP